VLGWGNSILRGKSGSFSLTQGKLRTEKMGIITQGTDLIPNHRTLEETVEITVISSYNVFL